MPKTKYVHHLTLDILNKRSKNYMVQTSKINGPNITKPCPNHFFPPPPCCTRFFTTPAMANIKAPRSWSQATPWTSAMAPATGASTMARPRATTPAWEDRISRSHWIKIFKTIRRSAGDRNLIGKNQWFWLSIGEFWRIIQSWEMMSNWSSNPAGLPLWIHVIFWSYKIAQEKRLLEVEDQSHRNQARTWGTFFSKKHITPCQCAILQHRNRCNWHDTNLTFTFAGRGREGPRKSINTPKLPVDVPVPGGFKNEMFSTSRPLIIPILVWSCVYISSDPACSRGSASEEKLPAASVRSESNVKQYRPLPGGPFRPSLPCCLTVVKALFSSLGCWALRGLAAGKFWKRKLVSCPFRKRRLALYCRPRARSVLQCHGALALRRRSWTWGVRDEASKF